MLIRQPIPRWVSIALGIASILALIALYSLLANQRARAKRANAEERVTTVNQRLQELANEQATLDPTDQSRADELTRQENRLRGQLRTLEADSQNAVDRTVPTWGSLYRDGLLRVLKPQGLKQDQYWLWEDATATFLRLAAGLALGVLLSIALGLLMGSVSAAEAFFVPPLSFLAKIPPTAMLAVFFVLVGTSFKMYVTMIAFGTLPTLAQTIYQSAKKDVAESMIFKAYTLGASHAELIWNVIFKQILPRLIDAARLQVGPAMVLLVAAEWMVAGEGFGYRLRLFYQRTDMTVVYVYLILLGLIGLAIDYALIWFRRWLCPWFGE